MAERRILYHHTACPFSRKLRLFLYEKGLPYGMIFETPWLRRSSFLKLSPLGEVPVLVEPDGHVLLDSIAICEYLNEIKPNPNLLGETPRGRAEVRRISNWFDTHFYSEVYQPIVGEKVLKLLKKGTPPDSNLIRVGRLNLKTHLTYLEFLTARRSYLAGRLLSLADLTAAAHLSVLDYLGEVPWDNYPETKIWYAKIKSRPSFSSLLTDTFTGIMPSENYTNLDF